MPPNPRSLRTRSLAPRDYLTDPYRFGRTKRPTWVLPAGGDARSLQVAMVTHEVVRLVRARRDRWLAARVCSRFGFSKQVWSRCLLGEVWMGEVVLAAAVSEILSAPWQPLDREAGR